MNSDKLDEALDRICQFFLHPLIPLAATARELLAVDSEHQKNLQSDGRRSFQVWRNEADDWHPLHHFSTGNVETLRVRLQDWLQRNPVALSAYTKGSESKSTTRSLQETESKQSESAQQSGDAENEKARAEGDHRGPERAEGVRGDTEQQSAEGARTLRRDL